MNDSKFTLLIPNKLPELLKKDRHLQRVTATLLLLRSRFPESRFRFCDMKEVSELCGFKSRRGFKNHLDALKELKLIRYEYNEAHKTTYVNIADWNEIKTHFKYERNLFIKYTVDFCIANNVLAILIDLAVKSEEVFFESSFRANLKALPYELLEAIKTVCGEVSKEAIHRYQLEAYTKGVLPGQTDEYYYAAYMLLHATKAPKGATEDETKAKRFYLKADTNVSTGYLSRSFGYKRRNGFCYWKKKLQLLHLTICERREYKLEKKLRTTTEERTTGIGCNFYDNRERCLKLRLVDEWKHISPEVAFSREVVQIASNCAKAA